MSITNISPIDGRYRSKTRELSEYFSEKALIKYRIYVEASYLLQLAEQSGTGLRRFTAEEQEIIGSLHKIDDSEAEIVKAIETKGYEGIPATNHDVKAVEYFIKLKLEKTSLKDVLEMVHFALTSEDINNLSYALMLRDGLNAALIPAIDEVYSTLYRLSLETKGYSMLARTHGQPASPTTFGKEMLIFVNRMKDELESLNANTIMAKLNGATGNYNAHSVVLPEIDWQAFTGKLIDFFNNNMEESTAEVKYLNNVKLKLKMNRVTPQIEPHDSYARLFDSVKRINTILIDFAQDIWRYISDGWIKQKVVAGEIGSSAMPHKVNPIDFENAEGNLGVANALFTFFSQKLLISRLQRDLSDSTTARNCGTAFANSLIAYKSLLKGLSKIDVDGNRILEALKGTPEVIAEAYQNILRYEGVDRPYELLKEATRGKEIKLENFHALVEKLDVDSKIKERLLAIRPENYTGIAEKIVDEYDPVVK